VDYNGTIPTANDRDWYVFYALPQTQLDISLTTPGDSPCDSYVDTYLYLRTSDGHTVSSTSAEKNQTSHIRYTTPATTTRFLIDVDAGCIGGRYRFRLDPATAIVSGPGLVAPLATPEPNESAAQAFGPLSGGTPYAGSLDTENDVDWFWFYTSGPYAFDLSLTNVASCSSYDDVYARLLPDGSSSSVGSLSAETNMVSHFVHTAPGAARYLVEVTGCEGSRYRLQLDPGTAISLTPPPPPPPPPAPPAPPAPIARARPTPKVSARCRRARAGQIRWRRAVTASRRQLRSVTTRRAKRLVRRKLAAQKRTLARADDRVTIYCR
ncbi:MAG TPA: hypothetical protein VLK58_08685, partial [Conexibacter sp.]|nr:hypothetical protein [Conexibacter sp.]